MGYRNEKKRKINTFCINYQKVVNTDLIKTKQSDLQIIKNTPPVNKNLRNTIKITSKIKNISHLYTFL